MTETASSAAARKGKGPQEPQGQHAQHARAVQRGGLRIARVHTTPGVHPYDQVTWERRDVVMTNWRDGSVNFEQHGVEFPDFWSVNAANIVTTKYFRGAVGSPQREWSLKQLVDRVVGVYEETGREHGYFATDEDAEIFGHELRYALVHQIFSFNSPVWFNVGTASPQQVSACQPYDALVSTPEGLVPIGKLVEDDAVGTKVCDAHGVTQVVATKANGTKQVLRLHTKAGHLLDVTPDHLVWRSGGGDVGRFVPAGSLEPGHKLQWHRDDSRGVVEIDRIEDLGVMEVYDIQTESGEYLSGNLRVHNCFILAVDDTMDSILEWYREEGLIFKGGSGAGVNLSRIRSSKELLSSGGTASGPVSFMRGADASAGTIKSGGATRRAAKMVVLDVDHPDVAEFIETKAREEEKVRVLRDAGFDMDLGGKDIVSVQYQNANNSVRVSDEFMRAVEEGKEFDLLARRTGEVVERVDARKLLRNMAQAAWECADPGIQYDDTINDWHTNPESGRISASNPCFPADQRVVTDKGLIRIGDLVRRAANEEQFAVYTNDVTAENRPRDRLTATTPTRYMVTGRNEILELRFSDGARLRCTPGHRIWTANRAWAHAEELTGDDKVVRSFQHAPRPMADNRLPVHAILAVEHERTLAPLQVPSKWDEEFAHYLGWLVGDGCIDAAKARAVTVYGSAEDKDAVLPRHHALLTRITGFESEPSAQPNGTLQLHVTREAFGQFLSQLGVAEGRAPDKVVPSAVYEAPDDAVTAFLRGLFDADGCVVDQASNETVHVSLGSRSEELLIGVQELLASLGIASRICKTSAKKAASFQHVRKDGTGASYGSDGPSYDLRITAGAIRDFHHFIGFSLPGKQAKLADIVGQTGYYEVDRTVRLVSRESKGFETTYNLTEPRNHSYVVGGTVVANCSEYLSLDNSSCNLASINLLKFLRDDSTFDAERFRGITQLIITAMDISITFADFPTEKIATVTRAYRQLGIGYANLGALLMATGHAYDSEGGRAIAAAITSLMTATAYKTSAGLAGVVGPYDGYERNAKPHKRVIRKHEDASERIRPVGTMERDILDLANQTWRECVDLGETHGYRNSQASLLAPTGTIGLMMDCDTTGIEPDLALVKFKKLVGGGSMQIVNQTVPRALQNLGYPHEQVEAITEYIAEHGHVVNAPGLRPEHYEVFDCAMGERAISPMGHVRMMAAVQPHLSGAISKCVTGETLVPSAEGLIRIGSLHRGEEEDSFREEHLVISSLDGDRKTDAFYYGGTRPVRRVRLRSGHAITGTYPHRLLVAGEGCLRWKTLSEIEEGDAVALQYGAELWATMPASLRDIKVSAPHGSQEQVRLPGEMSTDLAFLLGAYASEGHITRTNWTIRITNSVPEVLERVRHAWQDVFGVQARIGAQPGKCLDVAVTSKTIVEFFDALGCGSRASDKRIPDAVLRSPREMVLAFLQGLALDAYVTTATPKWAICLDSRKLLDDLQVIMTNLGVLHGRVTKQNQKYGKDYDEIYAAGLQGQLMTSLVPFLEPDKAARAAEFLRLDYSTGTADVVPGVTGRELYAMIPLANGRGNGGSWRSQFAFVVDPRTQHVTHRTLERIAALPGVELPGWLRQVIDGNLHFSPVDMVTDVGEAEVYDLSVPDTRAFVANGIMNHNTVNMPESATVEDIERIYFEGWKLGLKALAIYRDNCKVGQPLSDARKKPEAAAVTQAAETQPHQHRPVRKRLPRQRPATVTRFSVAGAEGYMTASSYPDDGIGEVFLKLGKQGSTLAGVMDAFSMAISVGLQYGIPLDSYVAKFTNMRFEPAGLTDDPDIRIASSVVDYIFRRLALDHLSYEDRAELGILSAAERAAEAAGQDPAGLSDDPDPEELAQSAAVEQPLVPERTVVPPPVQALPSPGAPGSSVPAAAAPHSSTELIEAQQGRTADAPLCLTCGTKMRPAGSCYVCEGCGSTSGCS